MDTFTVQDYVVTFEDDLGNKKEISVPKYTISRTKGVKDYFEKALGSSDFTGLVDDYIVTIPKNHYELYKHLTFSDTIYDLPYPKHKTVSICSKVFFHMDTGENMTLYNLLTNHLDYYTINEEGLFIYAYTHNLFFKYTIDDVAKFKRLLTKEIILRRGE
jgi:hypothetical protein